ncbi:hypothetical protein C8J57DRAFT_1237651 [Mycena rebaudengoi]|nr:hypothetical protein C8J57DRAFT_1237651 [Mycena rebaudengoi]
MAHPRETYPSKSLLSGGTNVPTYAPGTRNAPRKRSNSKGPVKKEEKERLCEAKWKEKEEKKASRSHASTIAQPRRSSTQSRPPTVLSVVSLASIPPEIISSSRIAEHANSFQLFSPRLGLSDSAFGSGTINHLRRWGQWQWVARREPSRAIARTRIYITFKPHAEFECKRTTKTDRRSRSLTRLRNLLQTGLVTRAADDAARPRSFYVKSTAQQARVPRNGRRGTGFNGSTVHREARRWTNEERWRNRRWRGKPQVWNSHMVQDKKYIFEIIIWKSPRERISELEEENETT